MKYNDIIPTGADWREQGYDFLRYWLNNIKIENRKPKSKQKRGMPYKRTLKLFSFWYTDQQVADIARIAWKVMDCIIKDHPSLKQFL